MEVDVPMYMIMSFMFAMCVAIPLLLWAAITNRIGGSKEDALIVFSPDEPEGRPGDQLFK